MLINFKALVVVLVLAWAAFAAARPLWLQFTTTEDFDRRRMVWFVLTIVAFASPSFWIYFAVAAPLVAWAAARDSAPLSLYLLLVFVIPPLEVPIPTVLIGQLFTMSNIRMLTMVIIVPAIWSRTFGAHRSASIRFSVIDAILLGYGLLQLLLFIPYEAPTNTMRRGFLFILDVYLVYFAFSRLLSDKASFADTLGGLCLAAAISAPVAVIESLRGWLLYPGIAQIWGYANLDAYLLRGDSLRAQAATGHSIPLGYIFAIALTWWLYLKRTQLSSFGRNGPLVAFTIGLFFTYARGPWLMAALAAGIFAVLEFRGAAQLVKGAATLAVAAGLLALTPIGEKVIENLPFIGTKGQESVTYRQQLAELSWGLVQQHPFFGNPFVMLQMEELRPGQGGIIDLVNGYAQVALFYGLVGLALFSAFYAVALFRAYSAMRAYREAGDEEAFVLGASLIAGMVSTLMFIATAGQAYHQWLLVGLLVSYCSIPAARDWADELPSRDASVVRGRRRYAS